MQTRELVELYFTGKYKRGVIVRFLMPCDDPNRELRNKFGIVLNTDLRDPDVFLAITTTNQRFLGARFIVNDTLRLKGGEYTCFPTDTIVSLREIKRYELAWLKQLCLHGNMTFEGDMSSPDMTEIDQKLAASQLIEGVVLKRIT